MSLNGPFDPRIRYAMGPHGRMVQVQRGWIEEDTSMGIYMHAGSARRVDFLFAPSTISSSYSMGAQEEDIPIPPGMDSRDSSGVYRGVTNQSVSFQLLFDRTFEVNNGDRDGVWRDAKAFLTLVGVEDESTLASGTTTGLAYGVMMFVPVWFRFGPVSPLRYLGVIKSLSIDYTLFNPDQIPLRGTVSVNAQLMPKNFATPATSTSRQNDPSSYINSPFYERLPDDRLGGQLVRTN
ncbi:hypothetical protein AB0G15_05385 [Streptosporangium sp. NPDC023825]|uniref:hypothetical protein n=1 Tax=Streptosporangium sp. NPDC023825 TaxID=3154909 RepID=UPI00341B57B0